MHSAHFTTVSTFFAVCVVGGKILLKVNTFFVDLHPLCDDGSLLHLHMRQDLGNWRCSYSYVVVYDINVTDRSISLSERSTCVTYSGIRRISGFLKISSYQQKRKVI